MSGPRYLGEETKTTAVKATELKIGDVIAHRDRMRTVQGTQEWRQKMIRIWLDYDAREERSGYEGYLEVPRTAWLQREVTS